MSVDHKTRLDFVPYVERFRDYLMAELHFRSARRS
jgi:hypothetical protein